MRKREGDITDEDFTSHSGDIARILKQRAEDIDKYQKQIQSYNSILGYEGDLTDKSSELTTLKATRAYVDMAATAPNAVSVASSDDTGFKASYNELLTAIGTDRKAAAGNSYKAALDALIKLEVDVKAALHCDAKEVLTKIEELQKLPSELVKVCPPEFYTKDDLIDSVKRMSDGLNQRQAKLEEARREAGLVVHENTKLKAEQNDLTKQCGRMRNAI